MRRHVCRGWSRRSSSRVLTAVSHHATGGVEIHACHVLGHLEEDTVHFFSGKKNNFSQPNLIFNLNRNPNF